MKVTTDTLAFVISYIEKHINKSIRVAVGRTEEEQLAFFADYNELDDAAYKRMMTSYRVTKKRALDKESGNDLVTITVTKKSHELLKQLSALHHVTLAQAAEYFESQADLNVDSQTWCFSQDDLQEQAKLVEKLTAENSRLQAELQLAKRQPTQPAQTCDNAEITRLTEESKYWSNKCLESESFYAESLKIIENLQNEIKKPSDRHITIENKLCQFVKANGAQCKNKATNLIDMNGFSVYCCECHKKQARVQ